MTPAEVVIDVFGGIRATARVLDVEPSTVCRWTWERRRGGTGGLVPQRYFEVLMIAATTRNKLLTLEHLHKGKPGITRIIIRRFR